MNRRQYQQLIRIRNKIAWAFKRKALARRGKIPDPITTEWLRVLQEQTNRLIDDINEQRKEVQYE